MEEINQVKIPCPNCKNPIDPAVFFCPICGKKIKEKPVGTGFWPMAGLFALCIVLPPLNIPLSFRYIRSTDPKAKMLGWVSIGIMVLSLIIITLATINIVNDVNRQVEEQMQMYLGF